MIRMAKESKKDNDDLTIKEISIKLDISESTVKKYLKDFDLPTVSGLGSKATISKETFQALSEIAKLRANGLSIQEIKELKSQEPSKHILDELEETQEPKAEDVTKNGSTPISTDDASALEVEKSLDEEPVSLEGVDKQQEDISEEVKQQQQEEEIEGEETESGGRRRRLFNYRYVERQISNDSKRISSFRRRLQNPNISIQERLFFEEALERRILFLNGWKHILRWVSSK